MWDPQLDRRRLEQLQPLEAGANLRRLLTGRLDERQAQPAHVVTEQVQRGLDGDRVRLHLEDLERRSRLLLQAAGSVEVALAEARDQLLHLRPHDVRVDANATYAAELEE